MNFLNRFQPRVGTSARIVFSSKRMIQQTTTTHPFTTTTTTSSSDNTKNSKDEYVYIHPLSQLVLEHLQTTKYHFLTNSGLDKGLTIHKDGTFTLRFPSSSSSTSLITPTHNKNDTPENKNNNTSTSSDSDYIRTFYDPNEKKHWLSVKSESNQIVGDFLLQDNLKPAWHSSKLSTPEKIKSAVDELVAKLEKESNNPTE